jgi:hypothetical protein
MAIDQAIIGEMAARLMEQLETAYEDDATITGACLIVAVDHDQGKRNTVHSNFSSDLATYEALGLLEYVSRNRFD